VTDIERLLVFDEAVGLLRVKPSTLRRWCWSRKIPYQKVGARVMFRPSHLEKWLAKQERRQL